MSQNVSFFVIHDLYSDITCMYFHVYQMKNIRNLTKESKTIKKLKIVSNMHIMKSLILEVNSKLILSTMNCQFSGNLEHRNLNQH